VHPIGEAESYRLKAGETLLTWCKERGRGDHATVSILEVVERRARGGGFLDGGPCVGPVHAAHRTEQV
jgi:hypothetical protein